MNKLLLFSIMILTLSACKGQKETTHNEPVDRYEVPAVSPDQYETKKPTTTSQPVPPTQSSETITDDNPPPSEVQLESLDVPDSLLVSLERTACYGTCPTFKFNIYNSGFAEFEGIRFVDSVGRYTGWVPKERLNQVKELANQINYFEMKDQYDNTYITDIPATITIVQFDGRLKRVLNRYEGPADLTIFERFLDGIVQELGFHSWKTRENED